MRAPGCSGGGRWRYPRTSFATFRIPHPSFLPLCAHPSPPLAGGVPGRMGQIRVGRWVGGYASTNHEGSSYHGLSLEGISGVVGYSAAESMRRSLGGGRRGVAARRGAQLHLLCVWPLWRVKCVRSRTLVCVFWCYWLSRLSIGAYRCVGRVLRLPRGLPRGLTDRTDHA